MKTRKILATVALSFPVLVVWACSGDESEPPGGGFPPPAPSSTGSIDPPGQGDPSEQARADGPERVPERRASDPPPLPAESTADAGCIEEECLAQCQSQGVTGGCVEGSCNCVLPEDAGIGDFDAFGDFRDPTALGEDPIFGDAGSPLDPGMGMPGADGGFGQGDPDSPFASSDPFGNPNDPFAQPGQQPGSRPDRSPSLPGTGDGGLGMGPSQPGLSQPNADLPSSSSDFQDPQPPGPRARRGSNPLNPMSRSPQMGSNPGQDPMGTPGAQADPFGGPAARTNPLAGPARRGPAQRSPFGAQPSAPRASGRPMFGGGDGGL